MEWTNVHSCLRDDVLTIANFRNTMETIGGGKLLRQHMNNCSYVMKRARVFLICEGGFEERERVSTQRDECPTLMSLR